MFNLRDLSRIWQGMLNTMSSVVTKPAVLLGLWKHESFRVIADRFVNEDDIKWFDKTMKRVVQEELGDEYLPMVDPMPYYVDFLRYLLVY